MTRLVIIASIGRLFQSLGPQNLKFCLRNILLGFARAKSEWLRNELIVRSHYIYPYYNVSFKVRSAVIILRALYNDVDFSGSSVRSLVSKLSQARDKCLYNKINDSEPNISNHEKIALLISCI